MSDRQSRVRIDSSPSLRPLGVRAAAHLRDRVGDHALLPSPVDHLWLKRLPLDAHDPPRPLRLAGEVMSPGALCDIVSFIGMCKWRVELVVFDESSTRSVFFDRDHVVSARSSLETERLGQVLYRHGALSQNQVAAASEATRSRLTRFGEAAVSLGFVGREELFELMQVQAREVFDAVVRTESGTFFVLEGFDERLLSFRIRAPIMVMLGDAVRRMDEMKYFRERVPSADHVPVRVPGHSPVDQTPSPIYEAVDGYRSVADICRAVRGDEFEVTRALFELVQAGNLDIRPPRPKSPSEAVRIFNRAMTLLMRELDAMDAGDEVREQLAEYASEGGVYDVLFSGAGPSHDGSLDAERIEQNFARLSAPADAEYLLAEWLHEYASYALFLARPHQQRADDGLVPPSSRPASAREKRRLSATFRAVLSSIAPPPQDDELDPE